MHYKLIRNLLALGAFLSLLSFAGCDEDETAAEPEPDPTECRLESVAVGTDITLTITYNSKGLPTHFNQVGNNSVDNRTDVFQYDNSDNVIKISSEKGHVEYEYNSENKVISTKAYKIISGSPSLSYHAIHYYNAKGQLDSTSFPAGDLPALNYERYEYDEAGNLIKKFSKTDGIEKLVLENLEFDDKIATYGNYYSRFTFIGPEIVDLTCLAIPFVGDHNVTKFKYLTIGGTWVDVQNTYEYNDLGYPTKRTTSNSSTTVTYTNECK